jgi:uncharacterized damage-inducible protein DinB
MSISQTLLPEFDHEMATTRRLLERLTPDKFAWQPHEKSMTLGQLASHLAELPNWVKVTLNSDELDFGTGAYKPFIAETAEQLLEAFDRNVAQAHAAIAAATDEDMAKPWALRNGEHVIFRQPKAGVLRSFTLSHIIHHRGQLTVYMRLTGIPVPSVYGPTADEPNV